MLFFLKFTVFEILSATCLTSGYSFGFRLLLGRSGGRSQGNQLWRPSQQGRPPHLHDELGGPGNGWYGTPPGLWHGACENLHLQIQFTAVAVDIIRICRV